MTDHVKQTAENGVQVLQLSRPEKKNALTQAMYQTLSDALESGDKDPSIRAHVIVGTDGVFTAGNDLGDFLAHSSRDDGGAGLMQVMRFIKLLPNLKKPLLAAVDGLAIGIGTTLLFHCDLVYATPGSTFATPFLDLGLVPEAGSSLLMTERMGYGRAFEMLVMGDTYTAEQMESVGLINEIVDAGKIIDTVMNAGRRLSRKPPEALELSRRLMRGDLKEINARIDEEAMIFAERLKSKEARQAFEGFLKKSAG